MFRKGTEIGKNEHEAFSLYFNFLKTLGRTS